MAIYVFNQYTLLTISSLKRHITWPRSGCGLAKYKKVSFIGSGDGLSHLGVNPLSEQMLAYCQLDPWGQNLIKPSVIFH